VVHGVLQCKGGHAGAVCVILHIMYGLSAGHAKKGCWLGCRLVVRWYSVQVDKGSDFWYALHSILSYNIEFFMDVGYGCWLWSSSSQYSWWLASYPCRKHVIVPPACKEWYSTSLGRYPHVVVGLGARVNDMARTLSSMVMCRNGGSIRAQENAGAIAIE